LVLSIGKDPGVEVSWCLDAPRFDVELSRNSRTLPRFNCIITNRE